MESSATRARPPDQSLGGWSPTSPPTCPRWCGWSSSSPRPRSRRRLKQGAAGGGMFAARRVCSLFLAGVLVSFAAVYGFAYVMPVWAAFLTVAGIYLVIAALLGFVGRRRFKKVKGPERAIAQVDADQGDLHRARRAARAGEGVRADASTAAGPRRRTASTADLRAAAQLAVQAPRRRPRWPSGAAAGAATSSALVAPGGPRRPPAPPSARSRCRVLAGRGEHHAQHRAVGGDQRAAGVARAGPRRAASRSTGPPALAVDVLADRGEVPAHPRRRSACSGPSPG